ncbi:MAG: transporter [Halioglobus sp.]|nr:transporter [Halioglobus sp.]
MGITGAERRKSALICLLALLFFPVGVIAQDLEPRSYSNLPVGQNYLLAGYAYSEGEITPAPSVPIKAIDLTQDAFVGAYARTLDLWGNSGKFDVLWSRVCLEGEGTLNGQTTRGDRCGSGDPRARLTYLFYGAPAMNLAEFKATPISRVIGASLSVSPPLGDYNEDNLINSGSNRWTFKPDIGISNRYGNWSLETSFGARFFTDNDSFFGQKKLEQDPLYQVQGNIIYHFPRARWLSLDGNYFWGGKTQKDGVEGDDVQKNSRVGLTLGLPLSNQYSVKFYANRGVVTRIGNDSDTVGVALQYRWGE